MDYRMQADINGASRPTLRIGERLTSGIGTREEEIAKAILPIDICSHRSLDAAWRDVVSDAAVQTSEEERKDTNDDKLPNEIPPNYRMKCRRLPHRETVNCHNENLSTATTTRNTAWNAMPSFTCETGDMVLFKSRSEVMRLSRRDVRLCGGCEMRLTRRRCANRLS